MEIFSILCAAKKEKSTPNGIDYFGLVAIQVCFPFIWGKFILSMTVFSWSLYHKKNLNHNCFYDFRNTDAVSAKRLRD